MSGPTATLAPPAPGTDPDDADPRLGVVAALRAAQALTRTWLAGQETRTDLGRILHRLATRIDNGVGTVLTLAADENTITQALQDVEDCWIDAGTYCFSGDCGVCTGCQRLGWPYAMQPPLTPDELRHELLDPDTTASHFHTLGIRVTHTPAGPTTATPPTRGVEPYAYAALRDASWLSRPDTRTLKKWHVDRGNGVPACSNERSWSSRANPMLDETTRTPIADTAEPDRCQRPGCRVRWPQPQTP
jgi:hypothetical protein